MTDLNYDSIQFPFEFSVQAALTNLGFHSIHDILAVEQTRFRQQYDIALNGCAGAIYQQAKNYLGMADSALRQQGEPVVLVSGSATSQANDVSYYDSVVPKAINKARMARYSLPLYNQLFSDEYSRFVEPGSMQSLDSPVSYLVYLLAQLRKMNHTGTTALQALLLRRPDLGTLLLNEEAFTQTLPTSDLVCEILSDAFTAVTGVTNVDAWLAKDAVYPLTLPFDAARTRIDLALEQSGLSFGDMFSTLSSDYRSYGDKSAAALAWSEVSAGLYDELTRPAAKRSLPVVLQFDEQGRVIKGESLFLQLANLWPGSPAKNIKIAQQQVTCKAQLTPAKPEVAFTLTFIAATSQVTSGLSVTAALSSVEKCQQGEIYWGSAQLKVTADNQPDRTLEIGVLVGDEVGSEKANGALFKEEAAWLEKYYGPDVKSAVAAQMSVPVDMLCQAAGISERQLQQALAIGSYAPHVATHLSWPTDTPVSSGVYGARYLWGQAAGLEGALPGTIRAGELKTTLYQLHRLQKLVRLHHLTQLPFDSLDGLLHGSAAQGDINRGTLRALGVYQRYQLAYQLDAQQVAALWGDISPYAQAGQIPLLDHVLAPAGQQPDFKLPLSGTETLNASDISVLAQAFAVPASTLSSLIETHKLTKTLSGVSALYRLSLLAESFKLSVEDLLALIRLLAGEPAVSLLIAPKISADAKVRDTLDLLMTLDEVVQWAFDEKLALADMVVATADSAARQQALTKQLSNLLQSWRKQANSEHDTLSTILASLSKASKSTEEQQASGAQSNLLTEVASAIAQQLHLDPRAAWALMVWHKTLLDNAIADGKTALDALFLSAELIQHYQLDEVALTPMLKEPSGISTDANLWQLRLAISDFAHLAKGDERARPVLLAELDTAAQQARLAQTYQADIKAIAELVPQPMEPLSAARLQRMVAFARRSGWSLNDLLSLLQEGPQGQAWQQRWTVSQCCGPRKASDRKALDARLGERRNQALLVAYKSACRREFVQAENKTWAAAFGEHLPGSTDVAGQLLIDPEMSAKVSTSRVAEAIASTQAFFQRIVDGRESEWKLTAGELQRWRDNDSRYAVWAANLQLRWHPDQYINPTTRQNKSLAFKQFENSLSQARLDKDSVDVALMEYLNNFEQVVNLDTLGAYQDGMDCSQSPIYFLGRSPNAPFEYFTRRWGIDNSGLRRWTEWKKIDLPTSSNVMTQIDPTHPGWKNYVERQTHEDKRYLPVQARLVVLSGRLYFIWVEARVVTPESMLPPASQQSTTGTSGSTPPAEKSATGVKKQYRHVISLVHQQVGGNWSIPVELYQGAPVDYLDPAPNLAAYSLPQHATDLSSLKYRQDIKSPHTAGQRLFDPLPVTNGDLLIVTLNSLATNPTETNTQSQCWLFDSSLEEISTSPRWDKDSASRHSPGFELTDCDTTESQLAKTIVDMNRRSYFYIEKKDAAQYYSTQVITPCIPEHWLFSDQQWISRGEAVFGNAVSLTLDVLSAGQKETTFYETRSIITLTPQQWAAVPKGSKLVHFFSYQGRAQYQAMTSQNDTLAIFTHYPKAPVSSGELCHGVLLLPDSSSNVVAIDQVDNALIELGQLAVAHDYVQQLGAEIRENAQGVQYLITQYLTEQQESQSGHAIHGTPQAIVDQQAVTMPGIDCKLFVGLESVDDIQGLEEMDDWMSADYTLGSDGTRHSLWSFNVPADPTRRKQVWLVTRVIGSPDQRKVFKTLGLPSGVKACQIGSDKKLKAVTLNAVDASPVYLLTHISVPENVTGNLYQQDCWLPSTEMNLFSKMSFTFPLSKLAQVSGQVLVPSGVSFRVITERDLLEAIGSLENQKIFTKEDWGWTTPVLSTATRPYTLNRSYRLPSPACHYFVVKVMREQIAVSGIGGGNVVGFTLQVPSTLNRKGYVLGLKENKVSVFTPEEIRQQGNALGLKLEQSEQQLQKILNNYDALFFALPWTENAFADVQQHGLSFQLDNLKGQESIQGYIPCEVPTLSTATITSSCSPSRASPGDVVQIKASVDLGTARFSEGAEIEIVINSAYELLVSGMSAPAGTQVNNNQLRLPIAANQREAYFSLPVRVLETGINLLPLATLTVSDKRSMERVLLAQPTIGSNLSNQMRVTWNWQYGSDANRLLTSSTDQPVTTSALSQKYLLSALTLTPQSGATLKDMKVIVTLPPGITVDDTQVEDLSKVTALKNSLGLLDKTWKTAKPDDDGTTTLTLISEKELKGTTTLVLPLKLDPGTQFFGAIGVEVVRGEDDSLTLQNYPIWQPAIISDKTLAVSAGCEPGSVATGYRFGERFNVYLLMEGLADKETLFYNAILHLPPQFSYSDGRIVSSMVAKAGGEAGPEGVLNGSYNPANGQLAISLNVMLSKGQQFLVRVPVDAIPDVGRDAGDTNAFFIVSSGNADVHTPDIQFGDALISGVMSDVIPMLSSGASPIPSGTQLPVGATFNYRVLIDISEAELKRQYGTLRAEGEAGPLITLTLADSLALVNDKVYLSSTRLSTLNSDQATALLRVEGTLRNSDYGIYAEDNSITAQTRLLPGQRLSGEFMVPVRVIAEGRVSAQLQVSAVNSALQQPKAWTSLSPVINYAPSLLAYNTSALPFIDLHFAQPESSGFSDPLPLVQPPLLASNDPVTPQDKRLVRLNTPFGQELVRVAQRNTDAVFLAATQDHPLPPMEGNQTQPLEQDSANLLYFWELFFHVPTLIAWKLNAEGRYDEAQEWLHRLMDPFPTLENGKKKSIWRCRLLTATFSYAAIDNVSGPVDPDVIASTQPEFYRRAIFSAYVKNLLDKGDNHYRELSRDGFNSAHQCYLLAASLIGEDFAPARISTWVPRPAAQAVNDYAAASAGRPGALFALPRSLEHQSLVQKLQQRLFNLRNGLTLDGKPLDLPLYDQPSDPELLLAGRASGLSQASQLATSTHEPLFRYNALYARTSAAVDVLTQFGNTLLSLIDRQQELRYQSLLIGQQKEMAAFVIGMQKDTLRMNEENRRGLESMLESAKHRLAELNSWIEKDVSDQESQALSLRSFASTMGISSAAMRGVGAALDLAPNIFGFADGGSRWGAIPLAISDGLMAKAEADNGSAMQIETREMYRHRLAEWKVSKSQTEGEVKQLEAQLRADTIQQSNIERQLSQYEAQLRQFDEQRDFMSSRFTNVALYQWLTGQVSALYYQVYDAVASLCLLTQAAWRYEMADYGADSHNFFSNSGWNDARRGLLAGETLRLGLLRMDQAYLSRSGRMLEIQHTVSLKQQISDGLAATRARQILAKVKSDELTAKELASQTQAKWSELLTPTETPALNIPFSVTERMLAERYPGHSLRQLVTVAVTLPCVIGPYEEVCATLIQKSGRFAISADQNTYHNMSAAPGAGAGAAGIIDKVRPSSSVALSSGLDDSGASVLNFGDEKLLPFEGNGIVGEWILQIPNPGGTLQKRLLASLNDIIVTFRYRAKDQGDTYAAQVVAAMQKEEEEQIAALKKDPNAVA